MQFVDQLNVLYSSLETIVRFEIKDMGPLHYCLGDIVEYSLQSSETVYPVSPSKL